MLVPYTTTKMYFNYPIFVIGYQDSRYGVNVTTCSSAYSLRDMYCFGLGNDTDAAKMIADSRRCTINFLTAAHLDQIEYAGYRHGRDKLAAPRFKYHLESGLPLLDDAFAALMLDVEAVREWRAQMVNFTAVITKRFVDDAGLVDGRFDPEAITPVGYAGDQYRKVYRTPEDVYPPGKYLRKKTVSRRLTVFLPGEAA